MFINYQTVGLKSGLFSLCVCFLSCWRSNTRFVIRLFFLMKKYFFLTFSYFKYFADQKFSCAVYLQEIMPLKPQRCPGAQIIQLHYSLLKLIMMSSWCHHEVAWPTVYSRMTFLLWDKKLCNFQTDLLNFAEMNADVTLEESQVVLYVYEERKQNGGLYFGKWSAAM